MEDNKIHYEDDLVIITDDRGDVVYKGMYDYSPYRRGNEYYIESEGIYIVQTDSGTYTMKKLA